MSCSIAPLLSVRRGAQAVEFYKAAFGAVELFRLPGPDGLIGHAEMKIGNSIFMMADEYPDWGNKSPMLLGGSPVCFMIYLENADAAVERAVAAGATITKPITDQFYGDRSGTVADPFGHSWTLATHIEDVPPEEMDRRMAEMMKSMPEKKSEG